jgi:hypothetical protein
MTAAKLLWNTAFSPGKPVTERQKREKSEHLPPEKLSAPVQAKEVPEAVRTKTT